MQVITSVTGRSLVLVNDDVYDHILVKMDYVFIYLFVDSTVEWPLTKTCTYLPFARYSMYQKGLCDIWKSV